MKYLGKEVPKPLEEKIISSSLVKVGQYNGRYHKFLAVGFRPDHSTYNAIDGEIEAFDFTKDDTRGIVSEVLSNVRTEPESIYRGTLCLSGDGELARLSHIKFCEENNTETELLYIGEQRFYVLYTNRSTLQAGNVLRSHVPTLNVNTGWAFDLFVSIHDSSPFIPDDYKEFRTWFQTSTVINIVIYNSPDFFRVIDSSETFGGKLQPMSNGTIDALAELVDRISSSVESLKGEPVADGGTFPNYLNLLSFAKGKGIETYVLNILAEHIERRERSQYSFIEQDWVRHLSPKQLAEQKEKESRRRQQLYKEKVNELKVELARINRRRVALFFEASGVVTQQSQEHIKEISKVLDDLAEQSVGTKGYAESELANALQNSKARLSKNIKSGVVIAVAIFLSIFIVVCSVLSNKSAASIDQAIEKATAAIEDEKFDQALELVEESKSQFRPAFLLFSQDRKLWEFNEQYKDALNSYLNRQLEMIGALKKANHGRIDDFMWEQIKLGISMCPQTGDKFIKARDGFNSLKEAYIKQ